MAKFSQRYQEDSGSTTDNPNVTENKTNDEAVLTPRIATRIQDLRQDIDHWVRDLWQNDRKSVPHTVTKRLNFQTQI